MRKIEMRIEQKEGKEWVYADYTCTDEKTVLSDLVSDLIAKKINYCTYITRITRTNNYDGTQTVVVRYFNNVRRVYVVPEY